jgi:hypothetical protein
MRFGGYDGTDYQVLSEIASFVDGTPSDGTDMPGRLIFSTTADGAGTPTERMRITSSGLVGIGTTSPYEDLSVVGDVVATVSGTFGNVVIPTLFTDTQDPTGFVNRENVISFDDGTRTFTITGNHDIYINAVKTTKSATTTVIADTTGLHWVYYDSAGLVQNSTTFPGWENVVMALVYWNTTTDKGILSDERHSYKMDVDTHRIEHNTVGTRYDALTGGLVLTADDTTFSLTTGAIYDEDIRHSIPATTTGLVLYKNGAADFEWDGPQTTLYKTVAGTIQYNNGNALSDVSAGQHVCYWVFGTNATTTPVLTLMGQQQNVTLASTRQNCKLESLSFGTLPSKEMKILYRAIYKNVAGTPTFVELQDLRAISNVPAGTFIATQHNSLTGLNWANSGHTIDTTLDLGSNNLLTTGTLLATSTEFVNATTTNATTTNFYSGTASSTSLFTSAFNFGSSILSLVSKTITAGVGAIIDFGGASSFEIPNGAGGTTLDTTGEVAVDSTSQTVNFYSGTAERVNLVRWDKTLNIENATTTDSTLKFRKYIENAITIDKVVATYSCTAPCTSGISFNLEHNTTLDGAGNDLFSADINANSSTTPETFTTGFGDATIPAGSYLWFSPSSASTTQITNLEITVIGYRDP